MCNIFLTCHTLYKRCLPITVKSCCFSIIMATTDILPTYHRYSNGTSVSTSTRRCRCFISRKGCVMILLVVSALCFVAFFEFRSIEEVSREYKFYKNFQKSEPPSPAQGYEAALKKQIVPPLVSEHYPVIQEGEDKDPTIRVRRETIKGMMKHAWDSYVRYAWGENELRPVSKTGNSGKSSSTSMGTTIVDSLDTLFIMGLMDEFKLGRDWIAKNYNLGSLTVTLSVFETNIRFVGGLLACFALTGDVIFREKSEHTAQKLLPAFHTRTGIPQSAVHLEPGKSYSYGWGSGGASVLSEFGTLSMEFGYLSDITGDSIYHSKVDNIRYFLKKVYKPRGLYPNYINLDTGEWGRKQMSMGAMGDSYYEYLLKEWLRSGREDQEVRQTYDEAMEAVMAHMLQTSANGLMYFSDLEDGVLTHKMQHLACFSGGMLALGATTLQNTQSSRYMEVAEGITHTCHESYDSTATKIGPESFGFNEEIQGYAKYYILRPEVIESYFYMWRLTKNPKYREWGWEAAQALQKHCWTPGGYTGINDVYLQDSYKDDFQQSFFLAETLKYLYLLFSDDSLISLDDWVFNTEGHPLPIKGINPYYRATPTPIHP